MREGCGKRDAPRGEGEGDGAIDDKVHLAPAVAALKEDLVVSWIVGGHPAAVEEGEGGAHRMSSWDIEGECGRLITRTRAGERQSKNWSTS